MPYWLYSKLSDTVLRTTLRSADVHGRNGADAGSRSELFVVEALDGAAAQSLAREWVVAEKNIGDMALAYRDIGRGRSYAYLTRL